MSIAVVDCAVEIRRSAEDVFDYVTDISGEFEWNPRTEGRVDATPDGARLTLHVELEPQGRLRLIAPLLGRIMRGREHQNLAAIKNRLERGTQANGGGRQ